MNGDGMIPLDEVAVRRRLTGFVGHGLRGDRDLNPGFPVGECRRAAAVLVPLVVHQDRRLTVLLTQRAKHLYNHAGQIAFPGGCIEAQDASPEHAALRETEEEVGLPAAVIEPLGRLDTYHIARTGFSVTPVVGMLRGPIAPQPDPFEVAEVFEVPLDFILDPANTLREQRPYQGKSRAFYAMPFESRYIWGATAAMLVNLRDVLTGATLAQDEG